MKSEASLRERRPPKKGSWEARSGSLREPAESSETSKYLGTAKPFFFLFSLKNFYILESFEIRILLDNNGNIIDKGFVRVNNIKEQELAYDINIQNYSCYYTDDNTSQFYHIEGNDNIYTKLRKGELNTICFKIE